MLFLLRLICCFRHWLCPLCFLKFFALAACVLVEGISLRRACQACLPQLPRQVEHAATWTVVRAHGSAVWVNAVVDKVSVVWQSGPWAAKNASRRCRRCGAILSSIDAGPACGHCGAFSWQWAHGLIIVRRLLEYLRKAGLAYGACVGLVAAMLDCCQSCLHEALLWGR